MSRIKSYQQLEHSDCGITCIRIVARYYGQVIPNKYLRDICDVSRCGMSLRDIVHCTRDIGFYSEAISITLADACRMPLPAILYWNNGHYVVLYAIDKCGQMFSIVDPALGKLKLSKDEFLRHWIPSGNRGLSIIMDPTDAFYSRRYDSAESWWNVMRRMLSRMLNENRMSFLIVAVLTLLAMVTDVVAPVLFQYTVDDAIGGHDISLVWLLVGAQFAVFFGNYFSNSIINLLLTKVGLRMNVRMVNDYLCKLIRLPVAFFDRKISSDFIQKIEDQNRIKNFLLAMPDTIFFTVVNIVVFSTMMVYYSSGVFMIYVIGTLVAILWTKIHLRRRKAIDYASFAYFSEIRNNVYELINGMQEIKINNAENTRVAVWSELQKKANRLSMKSTLLDLSVNIGNTFLSRIRDIVITGLCATMVVRGKMTIGEMMTVNYIAGRLAAPFANIISLSSRLQDAAMSYERLDEIMNRKEEMKSIKSVDTANLSLCFDGVSFKYPGSYSPFVINDFSVTIEQGKTTAIVGASGCGKTTLIKLMLGFYTPQKGFVTVGNVEITDLKNSEWMRCCGVVMQNGYIFSGTILENIALADSEPDVGRVREAARVACIDSFVSQLPMGYNTRLGNAGIELSGGQKQRLFIARAVYRNPQVLFLDEATSSLDANNEFTIVHNIVKHYKGRTVIVAAHRLSTVRHADKIIYVDKGRIVETGTHDELVAHRGAYYRLVKEQLDLE